MKKTRLLIIAAAFVGLISSHVHAELFPIVANIEASDEASFTVSQVFVVQGEDDDFQPYGSNTLDFGTLEINENGVFAPAPTPYYFAIDVGSNGAGFPDLDVTYTDTNNPNGNLNDDSGLGGHATINFASIVTLQGGGQEVGVLNETMALGESNGETINDESYPDGFLRISLGLATGSDGTSATPLTAADTPGSYEGDLTFTATFD